MKLYEVWLQELPGISLREKKKLLQTYGTPETIYEDIEELGKQYALARKKQEFDYRTWKQLEKANMILEKSEREQIHLLSCMSGNSSQAESVRKELCDNPVFPLILYYKGTLPESEKPQVGIIGSRCATRYGKEAVKLVCKDYIEKNCTIVSGMAEGIDKAVHKETHQIGGQSCAFLPHGLDLKQTQETQALLDSITERGALISAYPCGNQPKKFQFIKRNELLSIWITELVVIEAREKSGTLNTAEYALKHKKTVKVVPNSIFQKESRGSNLLLYRGAAMYLPETIESQEEARVELKLEKELLEILELLKVSAKPITEICKELEKTRVAIEEHLMDLELSSLVQFCGDGKWHYSGY